MAALPLRQPNPFDQFDTGANPFDQFDTPVPSSLVPGPPTIAGTGRAAGGPQRPGVDINVGPGGVLGAPIDTVPPPTLEERIIDTADYTAGTAAQGLRGWREGVANLLGLPVDAVNNLPRLLSMVPGPAQLLGLVPEAPPGTPTPGPITANPVMGGKFIDEALGGFGLIPELPPPTDPLQEGVRRVGQEVGGATVPAAGALATALRLGVKGSRELGPLARHFVEPAAIDPVGFAVKEGTAATAAGTGAALADQAQPDSPTADIVGAVLGALGFGGGAKIIGKGVDIFNAARQSPNYVDDTVREAVTDAITQNAGLRPPAPGQPINTDDLVAAISGGKRIADTIPGFQESLADRTGNAGLASLEFSRQSNPVSSGLYTQRRGENLEAVNNALQPYAPQEQPGAFRSALEDARDVQLGGAAQNTLAATNAATQAAAPLQVGSTQTARGNLVRTALSDVRDAARERTAAAYDAANVNDLPVDPVSLRGRLEGVTAGLTEAERGLAPQGLVDRIAALGAEEAPIDTGMLDARGQPIMRPPPPPDPIRMKEATDLRSELGRLRTAALADPRAERGGRNAARVLQRYADAVDAYIAGNLDPGQQQALEAARGAKFEEAEAFTRTGDPVAAALAEHPSGQPKMRDERVAGSFVNPQNMDRLFAQADTPQVRTAIREELLSRADTGTAQGIQDFIASHPEQLARFPGLQQELERAGQARGVQQSAQAAESELMQRIGPEGSGTVSTYLKYGNEKAQNAMTAVMADKQPAQAIDELLTFVGDDPQAVEGARKVFWDIMQKKTRSKGETTASIGGTQPWRPSALKNFLDDPTNRAVAERLWRDNPEHLENVHQIADALQNVDLKSRAKAPSTSGTAQGVNPLLTPETLQSRAYALKSGRIGLPFFVLSLASTGARRATRLARGKAIDRMLDEALNNPEAAATLLQENNPANRAALARKAKLWFGNEASTIVNLFNEDDDEEDPVVQRAMGR